MISLRWPLGVAMPDDPPIMHAVAELVPTIKAYADEAERSRRIPEQILAALRNVGVFAMAMPRAWGGLELDPITQVRVLETLGAAHGSTGWCAMVGCDGGYMSAFLDQEVAREMYADVNVATAPTITPTGKAIKANGGYRVSGRFPFASGCEHSTWMVAGCVVHNEGGSPSQSQNGVPETRQCFIPASQCRIVDTWEAIGLRATGSHDYIVEDVFVPLERTFSFQTLTIRRPGPLYAFPWMFLVKAAAPLLGIARQAIDAAAAAAVRRPARRYIIGGSIEAEKKLSDEALVQGAIARAEALLGCARSYLFDSIGSLWDSLCEGRPITHEQAARLVTLYATVAELCVNAAETSYRALGGHAVYTSCEAERCLRDLFAARQHVMGSLKMYEVAGQLLLGLSPAQWFL